MKKSIKLSRITILLFIILLVLRILVLLPEKDIPLQSIMAPTDKNSIDYWIYKFENNLFESIVSTLYIIFNFINAFVFIKWFYYAYSNLDYIKNHKTRYPKSMTKWVWIIPVFNFFAPLQMMLEISRSTQKHLNLISNHAKPIKGIGIIYFWWSLFLMTISILLYSRLVGFNFDTHLQFVTFNATFISLKLLSILTVIFLIFNIYNLQKSLEIVVSINKINSPNITY